jgi:hypothetical protein
LSIYEALLELNSKQIILELEGVSLDKELSDLKKPVTSFNSAFFVTAQRFMSQLTQELTTLYMNLLRERAQMQDVPAEFRDQLATAEETLSRVTSLLFEKCSSCFSFIFNSLLKALEALKAKKEDAAWEGVEDKFKAIKTRLVTILFEGNGFLSLTRMFA